MAQPAQLGAVEKLGGNCLIYITYYVSYLGQLVWQGDRDHAEPFLISC